MREASLYEAKPRTDGTVSLAPLAPAYAAAARRLPEALGLGCVTWFDAAWRGGFFDALSPERAWPLSALRAYAAHPLVRCVEWPWPRVNAPSERYLEEVAQASGALRVICRAGGRLGDPCLRGRRGEPLGDNPEFLSAELALSQWLHPCARHFGKRAHLLVDLLYDPRPGAYAPAARARWLGRLEAFLSQLAEANIAGLPVSVAVRSRALFTPAFLEVLHRTSAKPALTVCSSGVQWPALSRGLRRWLELAADDGEPLLMRWLSGAVRGPLWESGPKRDSLGVLACAGLAGGLVKAGRRVDVLVAQTAEGNAPQSLYSIAEAVLGHFSVV